MFLPPSGKAFVDDVLEDRNNLYVFNVMGEGLVEVCRELLDIPPIEQLKLHLVIPASETLDQYPYREMSVTKLHNALSKIGAQSFHGHEDSVRAISENARIDSIGIS